MFIVALNVYFLIYFSFRYWNTNFSQNPEKYIKHTPKQVEEMINSFFDSTA